MRVLFVCPELPDSNSPGSMAPCARQIDSLVDLGITAEVIDMRGIPKLKYVQLIPKIRRAMKRADLVHAHFGYCGWLAYLARKTVATKPPIVMSYMGDDLLGTPANDRGDLERFSKWMVSCNQFLSASFDRVIVKSQEMADVLGNTRSSVIPNGVDTGAFSPADLEGACNELGWKVGPMRVLFPGNPENPRKGHAFAIAAVQRAKESLGKPIELIPLWNVEPDRVATYMNACQAMVMTSFVEGSPNVVKEAMACNRPIVGVDVGDVQDLLTNVNGCWISERKENEFALSLRKAIEIGSSQGRDAIMERGLDLVSVAQRIKDIYFAALDLPAAESSIPSVEKTGSEEVVVAVESLTGSEG